MKTMQTMLRHYPDKDATQPQEAGDVQAMCDLLREIGKAATPYDGLDADRPIIIMATGMCGKLYQELTIGHLRAAARLGGGE
jgi:hypothetical protein